MLLRVDWPPRGGRARCRRVSPPYWTITRRRRAGEHTHVSALDRECPLRGDHYEAIRCVVMNALCECGGCRGRGAPVESRVTVISGVRGPRVVAAADGRHDNRLASVWPPAACCGGLSGCRGDAGGRGVFRERGADRTLAPRHFDFMSGRTGAARSLASRRHLGECARMHAYLIY